MTDLQLLLSIGIPCLLIALSTLNSAARFNSMEKRMDKIHNELRDFREEHRRDLMAIYADLKETTIR
jgi:phosphoglycerate-specific signal transduction histidine kinase